MPITMKNNIVKKIVSIDQFDLVFNLQYEPIAVLPTNLDEWISLIKAVGGEIPEIQNELEKSELAAVLEATINNRLTCRPLAEVAKTIQIVAPLVISHFNDRLQILEYAIKSENDRQREVATLFSRFQEIEDGRTKRENVSNQIMQKLLELRQKEVCFQEIEKEKADIIFFTKQFIDQPSRLKSCSAFPPLEEPFIARNGLITQLKTKLGPNVIGTKKVCYLTGPPGIGKTQTVKQYINQEQNHYSIVLFINAESEAHILDDYRILANKLGIPVPKAQPLAIIDKINVLISLFPTALIVFDNLVDNALLTHSPKSNCHVLVTSQVKTRRNQIDMSLPSLDEAASFLCHALETEDIELATQLASEMGKYPLGLAFSVGYIRSSPGITLKLFLDMYKTRKQDLWKQTITLVDYPKMINTVWSLSLERLQKDNPTSSNLIEFLSFLGSTTIPFSFIQEWSHLNNGDSIEGNLTALKLQTSDLLRPLLKYELLSENKEQQSFFIHPIFRDIVKSGVVEKGDPILVLQQVTSTLEHFLTGEITSKSSMFICQVLQNLIKAIPSLETSVMSKILEKAEKQFRDRSLYVDAIKVNTLWIKYCPNLAAPHKNLCYIYSRLNPFAKKYEVSEKAIYHGKKAVELEPTNSSASGTLSFAYFLGLNEKNSKKYADLSLQLNPNDPKGLNSRALLFRKRKEFKNEKKTYRKAIAGGCKDASIFINFAQFHRREQKIQGHSGSEEAATLLKRALEINPHDTLALEVAVNNYSELNQFEQAESACVKLLKLKHNSKNHFRYSMVLWKSNKRSDAISYFQKGLNIFKNKPCQDLRDFSLFNYFQNKEIQDLVEPFLASNKNCPYLSSLYCEWLIQNNEYSQANVLLENAHELLPHDTFISIRTAYGLVMTDQIEKSMTIASEVIQSQVILGVIDLPLFLGILNNICCKLSPQDRIKNHPVFYKMALTYFKGVIQGQTSEDTKNKAITYFSNVLHTTEEERAFKELHNLMLFFEKEGIKSNSSLRNLMNEKSAILTGWLLNSKTLGNSFGHKKSIYKTAWWLGVTRLHVAATQGWLGDAKKLVREGVNINKTNTQGFTPLDDALRYGNPEMYLFLKEKGAKLSKKVSTLIKI